jgi:hypothetical protein
MPVIAHIVVRSTTPEQYDAVRAKAGWLDEPPTGGLAHLTWWEGEDCHNVDAWESEQALQDFADDRLGPAMAAVGVTSAPEITVHAAHEVFAPKAAIVTATAS